MTDDSANDNFLRRWSRRKIDESAQDRQEPDAESPDNIASTDMEGGEEAEDVTADLPDIETLDKDSDYTVFLRDGVPDELKRLALRKLWVSDPILANLDGLNDYDEDFGAILRTGAEYMQRLAKAGEKFTRPGAENEDVAEDAEEIDDVDGIATHPAEADEEVAEIDVAAPEESDDSPETVRETHAATEKNNSS